MANNIDLSTAINNFQNAVYGKDVRDSLVEVAEAVQDLANNQVIALDTTLSESGKAADAAAVGAVKQDVETLNDGGLVLKDDVIAQNVTDWLDDHPEATTTVQNNSLTTAKYKDGSITAEKLSDDALSEIENPLTFSSVHFKTLPNDEFQGNYYTSNLKAFQSGEYNPDLDRFVLGYSDADNSSDNGLIVELDSGWNFLRRVEIDGGHMNDITYNPNTGMYYIAASRNNGEVVVVDPETLAVTSTITITGMSGVAQIAYNAQTDMYFVTDTSLNTYLVDSTFTNVELLGSQQANTMHTVTTSYIQGSCVYCGRFVSQWWLSNSDDAFTKLFIFGSRDFDESTFFEYQNANNTDESEALICAGETIYSLSYYNDRIIVKAITTTGKMEGTKFPSPVSRLVYSSTSDVFQIAHDNCDKFNYYVYRVDMANECPGLGLATGLLIGFKNSDNYGWQEFVSHNIHAQRTMNGGTWSNWTYLVQDVVSSRKDISITTNSSYIGEKSLYAYYSNGFLTMNGYWKFTGAVPDGTKLFTFPGITLVGRPYEFIIAYDKSIKGKLEVNGSGDYSSLKASGAIDSYSGYLYINAVFVANYTG